MYLDYSKLKFDADGIPETPELVLQTMSRETIGVIPGVHNLKLNVKFSEPSEMSFDVPAVIDGQPNWIYDQLNGHKLVYTEHYGIYLLLNPSIESDGIEETKHIQAYSLEKTLDTKKLFLEEGTFKFYDQTNQRNGDTIMGHILEIALDWSVGYVSPSVAQRYRTFDQYDDYLLSFIYNTAPEKFRCVFVFDPYQRTISAYDVDEQIDTIPIYLDFDNLLESLDIEEMSEELVTAIRPYGADGLDIREVNPIGTNWIYNIDYFIENGDIPTSLANKWAAWQKVVLNNRERYRGMSALRASATLNLVTAKAALKTMESDLEALKEQQSVIIQAQALASSSNSKATQQSKLDEINDQIAAKKREMSTQQNTIDSIARNLDTSVPGSYAQQIDAIVKKLDIVNYFTPSEYKTLSNYFIEQDITEETFVATDIDTDISGQSYTLSNEYISLSGSQITEISLSDFGKTLYTMTGGSFSFSGNRPVTGDVIRGTLERKSGGGYVLSIYAGSIMVNGKTAPTGCITLSGNMTSFSNNIRSVTVDGITSREGTSLSFNCASGSLYLTANISEYERYSVGLELYDYAMDVLKDVSTPTYEFSVDSGNFIFAKEFAPFRDSLKLGKGIYLRIGDKRVITPYIIEFELDFEARNKFSIVFSNRFKRHDEVNTLKDMLEKSYSSGRSFDASKYIYNQVKNFTPAITQFMNDSFEAAKNMILAAANQSVIIDGAGIHVSCTGSNSDCQLRIVNGMIAITDDNWEHVKLAIGLFQSDKVGRYFGVNAEVIGGKLIVGNNLIIENENDQGVMQFKVDSSGAWLNNSTFVLQKNGGGKIIIDPKYGIVAGNGSLYSTSGTTVYPSFIYGNGNIYFDSDGMPRNSNFYLDIRNGNAYFRGTVKATAGKIGGWTIESDYLHAGSGSSYVALNASTSSNSAYAIWCGASNPSSAPFWVKKNGDVYMKNGTFKGIVQASAFKDAAGNNMMSGGKFKSDYLNLKGINIGNGNFKVDSNGNVSIRGNITMAYGSYINWANVTESNASQSAAYSRANSAYNLANFAKSDASSAYDLAQEAIDAAYNASISDREIFNKLTNNGELFGIFSDSTSNELFINANYIQSGTINANIITLGSDWGGFECGRGRDSNGNTTYGAIMYGSDRDYYFIATNAGVRMQTPGASLVVTDHGAFIDGAAISTSDRRLKNSISYDMDKYDSFFMKLRPCFHKFNNGKSGRFHTGYIAQDVERALLDSGLDTKDFAGFVKTDVATSDMDKSIEGENYRLRYSEFVPLNTYMIQKLYRRIEALEAKMNSTVERRTEI